jgi:hypothetical protein
MVKILDKEKLKSMTFDELKKHLKKLRKEGYDITNDQKFDEEDDALLRRFIIKVQQKGVKTSKKEKVCKGLTLEQFQALPLKEAGKLLRQNGLINGLPKTRPGQFNYLCSTETARCNPEEDLLCDDGLVCDASNTPGVCVNPEEAKHHEPDNSFKYKGKTIVGTLDAITSLKNALEESEEEPSEQEESSESEPDAEEIEKNELIKKLVKGEYRNKNEQYWKLKDLQTLRQSVMKMKEKREMKKLLLTNIKDKKLLEEESKKELKYFKDSEEDAEKKKLIKKLVRAEYRNKNEEYWKLKDLQTLRESVMKMRERKELIKKLLDSKYMKKDKKYWKQQSTKDLKKYVKESEESEEPNEESDQSEVNIEDLLDDVEEYGNKSEEVAKIQKHVLKCLGLLS